MGLTEQQLIEMPVWDCPPCRAAALAAAGSAAAGDAKGSGSGPGDTKSSADTARAHDDAEEQDAQQQSAAQLQLHAAAVVAAVAAFDEALQLRTAVLGRVLSELDKAAGKKALADDAVRAKLIAELNQTKREADQPILVRRASILVDEDGSGGGSDSGLMNGPGQIGRQGSLDRTASRAGLGLAASSSGGDGGGGGAGSAAGASGAGVVAAGAPAVCTGELVMKVLLGGADNYSLDRALKAL
jgi:hypothetical protein